MAHLRYVAARLLSLSCSASGCEHSWSIEGWIHSKKRNRMTQATVDRLVRSHTNLLLEAQLAAEMETQTLPWDAELELEEPEAQEDDEE
eukprot:scaffold21218_cov172-Isochrysis_galbana.AAC.2